MLFRSPSSFSPLSRWWLVPVLVLTLYRSATEAITCSRCTTSGTRVSFPVYGCDLDPIPADQCNPEQVEFEGWESVQQCEDAYYQNRNGQYCSCPKEKRDAVGDGPAGSCSSNFGTCDCKVTQNAWPSLCPPDKYSTAFVCTDTLYVCWNAVPPQVLGLVDAADKLCEVDDGITQALYCDDWSVNNIVVGDGGCGTLCRDGRTCPNGKTITNTFYITSPDVSDGFYAENARGCKYDDTIVSGWTVSASNQNTRIANFDYSCPGPIDTAPGLCGAYPTFTPPACEIQVSQLDFFDGFAEVQRNTPWFSAYFGGSTQTCYLTIQDTEPPTITCPTSIDVAVDVGQCSKQVSYDLPTVSDNCAAQHPTLETGGIVSGSYFPIGTTTNTYTTVDAAGNAASCSFDVRVSRAATAPKITCPDDDIYQVAPPGECGVVVDFDVSSTGACGGSVTQSIQQGLESGSTFPVGMTVNTFQAIGVDPVTPPATCTFNVIVQPEAPTITCPVDTNVGYCDPTVTYAAASSVGCGVSVTQTGPASGSVFPVGITSVTGLRPQIHLRIRPCVSLMLPFVIRYLQAFLALLT
jgi:hypothetical protein